MIQFIKYFIDDNSSSAYRTINTRLDVYNGISLECHSIRSNPHKARDEINRIGHVFYLLLLKYCSILDEIREKEIQNADSCRDEIFPFHLVAFIRLSICHPKIQ